MTATEWTAIMVLDAAALSLWVVGESAYRSLQRALAADTLRRIQAETAHYDFLYGGSAGSVGVETPPSAPECRTPLHPGVGPQPQAGDSRLGRDSAEATGSDGSQPASGSARIPSRPDAGLSSRSESAPPDPAPIGVAPHPRGEGVGVASPRLVAPTRSAA